MWFKTRVQAAPCPSVWDRALAVAKPRCSRSAALEKKSIFASVQGMGGAAWPTLG